MTKDSIAYDLERSYYKFSRQIGTMPRHDVQFIITEMLHLDGVSRRLVEMFVDQTFKFEAVRNQIRTDGRLIELIKEELERRGGRVVPKSN